MRRSRARGRRPDRIATLQRPDVLERLLVRVPFRAERCLILVVIPVNACAPALDAWAERQARGGRLDVIGRPGPHRDPAGSDPGDRQRTLLGTERGSFYARLPRDARASDLAALLGTLRAGHTAILALPREAVRRSYLLRRLTARRSATPWRAATGQVHVLHPTYRCLTRRAGGYASRPVPQLQHRVGPAGHLRRARSGRALVHQEQLHRVAVERLRADPLACVIIIGPRGTGKSTLLARLVPELQAIDQHRRAPLVISAGARRHVALSGALPGTPVHSGQTLLAHRDRSVVIDEASALPLSVLHTALERHARVVMASTVEGYEASGRAFAGRFLAGLAARRPNRAVLRADQRFRFDDDGLNRALRRAFFLDALDTPIDRRAPVALGPAAVGPPALGIERIGVPLRTADDLAARIIALLGSTHYRITLDELDALLDGRLDTFCARGSNGEVVGVAVVAHEGPLDESLHADILARRRRLPDQLLPQLLARCAADASALGERYARITRIAVAPGQRRRGIATRLVHAVRDGLPADVAVGASFAGGIDVERFWQRTGLRAFHRGQRINPRSGTCSVAVLDGGSRRTREVLSRARRVLADNAGEVRDASRDAELLAHFSRGERGVAETLGALNRAWQAWSGDPSARVTDAGPRLGLPDDAGGRRLERALTAWAGQLVP